MQSASVSNRSLATFAAIGVSYFVLAAALLPLVQPGYDISRQAISELALGPAGWLLDVGFCIMAGAWVALAIVLRRTTDATLAPALLTIAAGLNVVSAFVHAVRFDAPMTTAGTVHMAAGIATFILVIGSIFAIVRPFQRTASWRRFAHPTLIWACVCLAAFILLGPGVLGQAHFGLQQRGMAVTFLSWLITTALLSRRVITAGSERPIDPATDTKVGARDAATS